MYSVKLIDDMKFKGFTQTGHTILMDENKPQSKGATPMELILIALGGCSAMDVVSILRKMRQNIQSFEIQLDYEKSDEHPKVYKKIFLKYIVQGENIDEGKLKRAIELSKTKYCSVSNMLEKTVLIDFKYEIRK